MILLFSIDKNKKKMEEAIMMNDEFKPIIERSVLVGIALFISLYICDVFKFSKFYAGIAALNVANLSETKTRRQAYERTITTFCGGAVACMIAYSGFQENMVLYVVGLIIVCFLTEMVIRVPATVGCIAFTYIMLNIDPNRTPSQYLEERVIGTAIGALVVALIVSLYNKYRNKKSSIIDNYPIKKWHYHFKRAFIPGIAVIIGVIIINFLNNHIDSKYVTRYTMYYCALASVVPFHIELKELFNKAKERLISTIFGGIIGFIFTFLKLNGNLWSATGIILVITFIEYSIGVSGSLGGIVFLFIMLNITEELTPLVYYLDRVLGTTIGIILILIVAFSIKEGKKILEKYKK